MDLDDESEALHRIAYSKGDKAAQLVSLIITYGWRRAADLPSISQLRDAAVLTSRVAPDHHRRIQALIALRAVAHVEQPDYARHITRRQGSYLYYVYNHLTPDQLAWARAQLVPSPAEPRQMRLLTV